MRQERAYSNLVHILNPDAEPGSGNEEEFSISVSFDGEEGMGRDLEEYDNDDRDNVLE